MNLRFALRAALLALAFSTGFPALSATQAPAPRVAQQPDAWPRTIKLAAADVRIYPPQVSRWADSQVEFRCAIAIKPNGVDAETFGVVFATARTHVDRETRNVALDNFTITKSDFPSLADHGAAYAAELQKQFAGAVRTVGLDRLQMSLAAAGVKAPTVTVRNDAPRVIVSNSPAILVPIDGAPVLRPVAGSNGVQRVVNTRALILKSPAAPQFFLHVDDGWLMSVAIDGPWTQPFLPPAGMDALAQKIAATGVVDMLDGGPHANPRPSLAQGIPTIYTSTVPAELVMFAGPPAFVPIVGTGLQWASNTTSDVLRDGATSDYFVLLAGRWFRSAALTGPWTFVASDALPADFAKIPPTSLSGAVLSTVAGTREAREAAIENSIPQTATVPLKDGPTFAAKYDGAAQFVAIAGTPLSYAVNSSVPVIQTGPGAFYAVTAGVWFTAAAATGPWTIATSVPTSVYTIPPSSPVFYVTFARIYGATATAVFEGYTPGYLGAVLAPAGTVVYGTGYAYTPWIGNAWFPGPATYGIAATPVYNRYVGHTYAFAMALGTIALSKANQGGAQIHPGYWGSYPCCGSASANVYRYWARAAYSKSRAKGLGSGAGKTRQAAAPAAPANRTTARATGNGQPTVPTNASALPPPAMVPTRAAAVTGANRGYDMTMVTTADSGNPGPPVVGSNAPPTPAYISANAYYASIGQNPATAPTLTPPSNVYADASGNVYRHDGKAWQQQTAGGWTNAPAPPAGADDEMQAQDRANQAAMQAGSYSISNTTRFTGERGDGWTRRDSGDGGYSRTLGGDGGISAEYNAYNDAVLNNEFDIMMNGGWWGETVYVGGIGWGGRYGASQ